VRCEGEGLGLVVRDEERRQARLVVQPQKPLAEFEPHTRVERAERLVEEQDAGAHGKRARQRDALPLPSRQLVRAPRPEAVELDAREGDPELGRLVESTVWVNTAHPAYLRAVASRSEGYHMALAVALALAPLAAGREGEHAFILAFLERWGSAVGRPARRRTAR